MWLSFLNGFSCYWTGNYTTGKLGHGDTTRQYKPKVIDSLHGTMIRKVSCGCHFSMALAVTGQVSINLNKNIGFPFFLVGILKFSVKGVWLYYSCPQFLSSNSEYPDHIPHYEASDLGFHYLLCLQKRMPGLLELKNELFKIY